MAKKKRRRTIASKKRRRVATKRVTTMTKDQFSKFIGEHRELFEADASNRFAFSFAKITEKLAYLEIIRPRYHEASKAFIANSEAMLASIKEGGNTLATELNRLHMEGVELRVRVHLELESYYLFAKIMLDEMARAIEHYFGSARGLSLGSHDKLTKNLASFAADRGLKLPRNLAKTTEELKSRISDYRDKQIAHENNPRTMRFSSWDRGGKVRIVSTTIYPKESDKQSELEDIDTLDKALGRYVGVFVKLFLNNAARSTLKRKGT